MDAVAVVESEVVELVRRRGLDPLADGLAIRRLVEDVVADYDDRALTSAIPGLLEPERVTQTVFDAVAGFGPLKPYLDDPTIEEIWINEPGRVFVARRGHSELTTTILRRDDVRDLIERMLKSSGRRVDLSTPFVDQFAGWLAADELVMLGTLPHQVARFLEASVVAGLNLIVAGGTQSGKTTSYQDTSLASDRIGHGRWPDLGRYGRD